MDITTRYNQKKETTIQYDITELLHDDLSDYVKHKLERSNEDEVKKFLSLFPLISQVQIKEIRRLQNAIKKCFPVEIYEDIKDEVRDLIADYKWKNSKDGKTVLQIEKLIKRARLQLSVDFPEEKIYIGRSFVNPISLVVGGYVKDVGRINIIEKYLADMNPPIAIRFSIKVLEE